MICAEMKQNFYFSAQVLVCVSVLIQLLTLDKGQKNLFSVFYFADILKILSVRHRVESHHEGKDGGGEKNGKKK